MIMVPPCRALPTVAPLQVVRSAAVTAVQPKDSTPTVVGMNTAGWPSTMVPAGPTAVRTNAIEPVTVEEQT